MSVSEEKREWLRREPRLALSRQLKVATWVVTGLVLVLVGLMRSPNLRLPLPEGVDLTFLPMIYSAINGVVAIVLVLALVAVLKGRIALHKGLMLTAMGLSVVFLLGYVAYHFTNMETLYGDLDRDGLLSMEELDQVGTWRPVYLVVLVTHIIAAGVSLPLILLAFTAAWTNRFRAHKTLARWVFPIWLYVAVTGPVCYLMLRPYY